MFFKDLINVINKNGEDVVKTEDNEIVDVHHVHHKYIGYQYKNVIANVFKFGLMYGDLHLTHHT